MNEIETMLGACRFARERTLDLLKKIESEADPALVLSWRPGPGRAHIGWQLMHIGATEELFATERLIPDARAAWPDVVARFKGGSTPEDAAPSVQQIRDLLDASRRHLEATLSKFGPADLDHVPPPLAQRGWTLRRTLEILAWHEAHHQGQAHLTYNLHKAQQPGQ